MGGLEHWLASVPSPVVYLVAFGLVFAESALFAGFLIPGETALLAAGVLAGLGHVNVVAVALCGFAGAVIGDSVGYEVGRHFGPRLRSTRLGRRVKPAHWNRGEAFMRRYGGRSVFLGRWAAFGRALIPALAGVTRMRYPTFLAWNALGGLTWVTTVVAVGFFAGGSWREVESIFGRAVGLVVLTVVVIALVVAAARWVARHPERVRAWAERQAARPRVRAVLERYDRQVAWVGRRLRPNAAFGLGLTVGLVLVGAAGWAFGALVQDVLAGEEATRFDLPVLLWFVDHRDATLTQVLIIVQGLTSVWAALAVAAVGMLVAWRRHAAVLLAGLAGVGGLLLAVTVESVVARTPPPADLAVTLSAAPGSFPALAITVTTSVTVVLAVQAFLAARRWGRAVTACTAGLLWTGGAGVSAAYLGTYWTTDILGAWALGATWGLVLLTAWHTGSRLRRRQTPAAEHATPVRSPRRAATPAQAGSGPGESFGSSSKLTGRTSTSDPAPPDR
jgi:undecaprenyl-diphosphatase